MIHVISGVATGETVVVSGQFMLDSESRLKEAVQKMMDAKTGKADRQTKTEEDFFDDME
jgi:Cu(I)/Ag(I) efflux system membrane fusion protein/cobalt-zinc-cadmium efflux system membrane fusion protein